MQNGRQAEMTAKAEAEDRRTAESEQFSRDLNAAVANHSVSLVAVDEMVARALEAGVIDLQDRSRLLSSAWSYAVERFLLDDLLKSTKRRNGCCSSSSGSVCLRQS